MESPAADSNKMMTMAIAVVVGLLVILLVMKMRKPKVTCVHGTVTNGVCVCATGYTGSTCATPTTSGSGQLTCVHGTLTSGACVCDSGYSGTTCDTASNQSYKGFPAGKFVISPSATGGKMVLDVPASLTSYGTEIILNSTSGERSEILPSQTFEVTSTGQLKVLGLCLDMNSSNRLVINACSSGPSQTWSFDGANQAIVHDNDQKVLDVPYEDFSAGKTIQLYNKIGSKAQKFSLVPLT